MTLWYSNNGGSNWVAIATLKTNPGTYSWALPAANSDQYRVQVDPSRSGAPLGSDTSNGNFTIGP